MADIGYRLRGSDGPMYNPERDYAYITPTLMRLAVEKAANDSVEEIQRWREQHEITAEEVVRLSESLARAQRDFINANDPVSTFEHALARHEFYNHRLCVRQLLFATIGEVCCAAWFKAVREVSLVGEESPAQVDMARFTATVREFALRSDVDTYNPNYRAELLQFKNDVLQTRVNALGAQVQKLQQDLQNCQQATQPNQSQKKRWSIFSSWSAHA
jgi:hypothetical protein